eukprot:1084871-Pleurochrysis_carterae.AAC.2
MRLSTSFALSTGLSIESGLRSGLGPRLGTGFRSGLGWFETGSGLRVKVRNQARIGPEVGVGTGGEESRGVERGEEASERLAV